MNELWENGYEFLSEEEKNELAMFIGMVEMGREINFSVRPIVMVAYNLHLAVNNPELVNFI